MIYTILLGGIALGVLVIVHEFGHFVVCKLFKVRVEKFSAGFGPRVLGKRIGDTEYKISIVPLGGYVKVSGQSVEELSRPPEPYDFISKPWWNRALIALGGPLMNFVFAIVLGVTIFLVGMKFQDFSAVAGRVLENSLPYNLGIRSGDRIKSANGKSVSTWKDLNEELDLGEKSKVNPTITVGREGNEISLSWKAGLIDSFFSGISPAIEPVVGSIVSGMPAYLAGMRTGDRIISVNSRPIKDWYDVQLLIHSKPDTTINVRALRNGRILSFSVKTVSQDVPGAGRIGLIGISFPDSLTYVVRSGLLKSLKRGTEAAVAMVVSTYKAFWGVVTHPYSFRESVGGPIAIVQMTADQAKKGIDSYLIFVMAVSIALMVFNLLPIPVLDGGHILFSCYEGISGRPLSPNKQNMLQKAGIGFIIALMVLALVNDTAKIMQRRHAVTQEAQEHPGADR